MNNQRAPITWQKLTRKSIVWFFWLFFLAILQTSVFARYLPFGTVPELVLPCVMAVAIHDGERSAVICGIMGGVVIDSLGAGGFTASALVYMLLATGAAMLTRSILSRDFRSWLIACICSVSIACIISSLYAVVNADAEVWDYLSRVFFRQLISSVLCSLPFYPVTRLIWHVFFNNREMEG